jgi:hypothetical protein
MRLHVDVCEPIELEAWECEIIESVYGAIEDCDFVVYWRKYSDDASVNGEWDGWPLLGHRHMVRVDDPNNWKHTWFLFLHS